MVKLFLVTTFQPVPPGELPPGVGESLLVKSARERASERERAREREIEREFEQIRRVGERSSRADDLSTLQ